MTLPVFRVERVEIHDTGSYSMYIVHCRRCGEEFWVKLKWAVLRPVEGAAGQLQVPLGRPCPHCSKVSEVPEDIRRIILRPRRVIRRRKARS